MYGYKKSQSIFKRELFDNEKGVFMKVKYPVIIAGAGPGDPDLITVKAQQALLDADMVIYAGSLVPEAVLKWTKKTAEILNSASMDLEQIIEQMKRAHLKGKKVVRLHTGDPSLYGAILEQMKELDSLNIPYENIPGVTAAFAASAAMGMEYTLPDVSQTLILTRMAGRTPVPDAESIESLAKHKASMVIYLSITLIDELVKKLQEAYGHNASCIVAYRVSQPEEKIIKTSLDKLKETVESEKITHQALIIVGKVFDIEFSSKYKSKLYDKNFSHGYRQAVTE